MTRPRILIVEDEIIIARELEARLTRLGYDVIDIASNGIEAVDMAVAERPDLVLMDIVLKGDIDGIEAAGKIRRLINAPVIYVTAYTDTATLARAKVTEPFGYIVKPFTERELNANIEMALYKHRVESRLRRVEQWFVTAMDEIGDAVIAADADGVITVFNSAAEAITAWKREDAIGRRIEDVLRLVERANGSALQLADAADGPVVNMATDTLLLDHANQAIPVDCVISCIRDDERKPTGTMSILRDATGLRHGSVATITADVSLATTQSLTLAGMLQLSVESIVRNLDATLARIWIVDGSGRMLLTEASAGALAHINGAQSRVAVGERAIGRIAEQRRPLMTNSVIEDDSIADPEWLQREGMVSFAGYPLVVGDQLLGVMGFFSRRNLPPEIVETLEPVAQTIAGGIERKRLEEQLRHLQKMEVIGQLAGGIAHDFNNLLTVIVGYGQLLLDSTTLDDDSRTLISHIASAGDRAAVLTRQLLAFARRQVLNPRVIDLNALVKDVEPLLRRLVGERVVLIARSLVDSARIMADPGQIEQVIMNLVVNAADAMPDGGRLAIETSIAGSDDPVVRNHVGRSADSFAVVTVIDSGFGMSQDTLARIFEPFFTTKPPGKGTGLGLATVFGIVQQSGGTITVDSTPSIGTTFRVYLPCTDVPPTGVAADARATMLPPGNETVLIAEDEAALRALAGQVLKQCGYTVIEAGEGDEAVRLGLDHPGDIHLLITDVILPAKGGRTVAEELRAARPDMKVLFISGYSDDAVIRSGVTPDSAFLQKPFTPSVLARKIREVLDGTA